MLRFFFHFFLLCFTVCHSLHLIMQDVIRVEGLTKSFTSKPIFENIDFRIQKGQKWGLIGLNGAGKSTLLKVIAGEEDSDDGTVTRSRNTRVVYVEQEPFANYKGRMVYEALFSGDDNKNRAVRLYMKLSDPNGDMDMDEFSAASEAMETHEAWDHQSSGLSIAESLNIDSTFLYRDVSTLSGGERKRCALSNALLRDGDVLLLDEPTNHLDIDCLEFLGDYLKPGGRNKDMSLLLVTHDRFFLEKVCDKIVELDRSNVYEYPCSYNTYLEMKAERLAAEDADAERARTKLRKEREWMSRQPQGRQAKSRAREKAYYALEDRAIKRGSDGSVKLSEGSEAQRLGKSVIDFKSVTYRMGDRTLVEEFSYSLTKGDRVGVVGPNGVGKSTFLRLLTGELKADSGEIATGETVSVGYYEQTGLKLDSRQEALPMLKFVQEAVEMAQPDSGPAPSSSNVKIAISMGDEGGRRDKKRGKEAKMEVSIQESVGGGTEAVSENDARKLLRRFNFPTNRWYDPVGKLSGGERRRLQLLQILARRPNVIVLDEPSNDLDLGTLSNLEEFLTEDFTGSLVVVSHDEFFMNVVCEHLLVFQGEGKVGDFRGTYSDYLVFRKAEIENRQQIQTEERDLKRRAREIENEQQKNTNTKDEKNESGISVSMSYTQRKEFKKLEKEISKLAAKIKDLDDQLATKAEEGVGYSELVDINKEADEARAKLAQKEEKWLELAELE